MSYDFSIYALREARVFDVNYTSNCSPVWHKAYEAVSGDPQAHFADVIEGLKAGDAAVILGKMIDWAEQQPREWLTGFDAKNGWGTGAGALEVLRELKRACAEHPDGRLSISR